MFVLETKHSNSQQSTVHSLTEEKEKTKMSEQTKELGVIGQRYEDRKNPSKCGVLVSRDEKYKTLIIATDDGKSISITNSTFKSNWRKVKTEEVADVVESTPVDIETEEVVTEESNVVPALAFEVEKMERESKKSRGKFDSTDTAVMLTFGRIADDVTTYVTDLDIELNVKTRPSVGGIIIKDGRRNMFELWIKPAYDSIAVCIRDTLYPLITWTDTNVGALAEVKEGYNLTHVVTFDSVSGAKVRNILSDIFDAIKEYKTQTTVESEVTD